MLEGFRRDLQAGTREGLLRAARRAYAVALASLAVPGVLLVAVLLVQPAGVTPLPAAGALYAVAVALAVWALRRATQVAQQAGLPARQTALTAAIQSATAPGVVLLLGCTLVSQPLLLAAFWGTALLIHVRVWSWLPSWVREPEPLAVDTAPTEERLPSL